MCFSFLALSMKSNDMKTRERHSNETLIYLKRIIIVAFLFEEKNIRKFEVLFKQENQFERKKMKSKEV